MKQKKTKASEIQAYRQEQGESRSPAPIHAGVIFNSSTMSVCVDNNSICTSDRAIHRNPVSKMKKKKKER